MIAVSLVAIVLVGLLLARTDMGRRMRAFSDNPQLASVAGIDADRVVLFTWALAGALAGLAGVMEGLVQSPFDPNMGWTLLLPIFAAVVLGTIGNAYGALLGGLALGVAMEVSTWSGLDGAGKTSLFNLVSGFQRADAGRIRFGGLRIDRLPIHRIARAGLARTFQQPRILHRMSVLENMLLAGPNQPGEALWRLPLPGGSSRRERELEHRARELLRTVRLEGPEQMSAPAMTLSGRRCPKFSRRTGSRAAARQEDLSLAPLHRLRGHRV